MPIAYASGPPAPQNTTLIDAESFEGTWPPPGWTETGMWAKEWNQAYDGFYSADFNGTWWLERSGDLTTPDLNCSDANAIYVDFWYRDDGLDTNDLLLKYYDGSNWDTISDLGSTTQENQWLHYQEKITDSQYFVSTFKVRWSAVTVGNHEHAYVDVVTVKKEIIADTPPCWSNAGTNNTVAGEPTLFHVKWSDDVGLSGFVFGTNNTGTWVNDTWTPMSETPDWSNVTKILNGAVGVTVQWRVWANDTSNNWSDTGVLSLTTTRAVTTQLGLCFDGSGSISSSEFAIITAGIAAAVRNASQMPHDGTVELTVVQFGTGITAWARVEVAPTVVTPDNFESIATTIEGISQIGGYTPTADGLLLTWLQMKSSPNFAIANRQVINVASNGFANRALQATPPAGWPAPPGDPWPDVAYVRDNAAAEGLDEIDAEGIDVTEESLADMRDYLLYPQPGTIAPPYDPGWVRWVANATEFAVAVGEKFITVLQQPVACFTVSNDSPNVCETVTFNATCSYDPDGWIVNYMWNFGDSNITTVTYPIITHHYDTFGNYTATLTVTDNDGLTHSASKSIWVREHPVARFTYSPSYPQVFEAVVFNASDSTPDGGYLVSYTWNFGDGNITIIGDDEPITPIITHHYTASGDYNVTLTVTDSENKSDSTTKEINISAPVNTPPVLDPIGPQSVDELATLSFTATATDPEVPPQTLTFSLGPGAPSGASISSGGVFSWTPTEAQGPGVYNINITVSDGTAIDYEVIAVTVYEVNVPPVLDPIGSKTVVEETLLSFTATASDVDLPAQTLSFSLGAGAPAGASITSGGYFTWTPTEAQGPGVYSVNITVSDGTAIDYEVIAVTVNEVNTPPVLDPIGPQSVDELAMLSFTATATDSDVPPQTLTFSLGPGAPSGASITSGGAFTWTPTEAQGPGVYNINITVSDGIDIDYEIISVTVYEVNQPPVLDSIGSQSVDEETLLSFTATASDSDIPAQTLTFSLGPGAPAGASITSGGYFTWTPTEAQGPGVYNINITVSDSVAIDYEVISVTVNEVNVAPVLDPIGAKTVDEENLLSFTATASDSDVPAQTLTFSLGAGAPSGASITNGGAFTWTPTEAQGPGVYSINITVSDGTDIDYEVISVTVNEVNQPPVLDPIGSKTVVEETLLSFTATASDADIPVQTLTFSLGAGAPAGASITSGGYFTWTPTETQGPGVYNINITVSDSIAIDYEVIAVTVNEVNTPPVLDPIGPQSVDELATLSFTATATDPEVPPQTLTFSLGPGAPSGASISSGGAFSWTPTETQGPGVYNINITVSDGVDTDYEVIAVTVYEVNVPPVLDSIGPKTVDEETMLSFTATASDVDIPAQTLTFSLGPGAPSGASITGGGYFTWTPTEAQGPGVYNINITVSDSVAIDYEVISVTVDEVNVAPVLDPIGDKSVDELATLSFTATASDSDIPAQTLTFSLGAGAPSGATITSGGAFSWTPTEAQGPGSYVTRIIVSDGVDQDYEDITVTVYEVNQPPVLDSIGPQSVDEENLLSFTATASDSDVPAQTLTFSLGPGAPSGASISSGGVFTWTPTEAQGPGVYNINITVSDGVDIDYEVIAVTVYEVNVPPVLDPIGSKTVVEETLLSFTATASDSDIPVQTLTFSLGPGAPAGASITSGGYFTWTPTEAQGPGVYNINITVSDGVAIDYEVITVTVYEGLAVSITPTSIEMNVDESKTFTSSVSGGTSPYTYQWYLDGTPVGTNSSSWTFAPSSVGSFTVYVNVTDNVGATAQSNMASVTVNPSLSVSIAPTSIVMDLGQSRTFTSTVSGGTPPYSYQWYLNGAPVSGATSASWTFTPTNLGDYTVYVRVTDSSDPTAQSNTASVKVNSPSPPPPPGVGGYAVPINIDIDASDSLFPQIGLVSALPAAIAVAIILTRRRKKTLRREH